VRGWLYAAAGALLSLPSLPDTDADQPEIQAGTITRIAPLPRAASRFAVDLDGRAGLTLGEETLLRSGIQVGDALDEAAVAALLAADETSRATEAALVFLAQRPRSEREVRTRLRRGGYRDEAIAQVIARLHDWRYLDDVDFARRWVENRVTHRPRGQRLLQQELRQKGIDAETAREVIAAAELDEAAAAEDLARHRLASYTGDDPAAVRRRLSAYLARRGYDYDTIRRALEQTLGETDEGDG
jgi:regulatory protein